MIRPFLIAILSALTFSFATYAAPTVRPVRFMTDDNVYITGEFYPATSKEDFAPAVLLLHSLERSRQEWPGVAAMLQRNGIACLVIDLRGHGESTRQLTANGPQPLDYHSFTAQHFADMLLDVNASINWLNDQPNIDKHRIAIIGSGLGASLALQYATFNSDLQALLLISPGDYVGLSATKAMAKLGPIALRIYVSRDDIASYDTAKRLLAIHKEMGYTNDPETLVVCSGNMRGGDMLRGVNQLPKVMLAWLQQVLLGVTPPAPSSTPPKK
jgi:pimeloyl-ACP methyl ester carboxylesterase